MFIANRSSNAAVSILLALVLFVCVTIISDYFFRSLRIDLTENGRFTLSQGTINTLKALDEPVTLRFVYSEQVATQFPQIRTYGDRVLDLLLEYADRAPGKLNLEIINPEPFSEQEDRAVALGITAVPTNAGDSLYFGLAGTNAVDGREVIAYFTQERESFLEYDVTEMIYKLSRSKLPKLGIIDSLSLQFGPGGPMAAMQGQMQPYVVYEQLSGNFDIEHVDMSTDRISEDIDVLMIVHPTDLSPQTLYAVDQFVLRGGRILAFIDPLSEMAQQSSAMGMQGMAPQTSSSLDPLLEAWGVTFDASRVVGDRRRALRVQTGQPGGRPSSDYVVWLGLQNDGEIEDFDSADPITANLSLLQLGSAGALMPIEQATTTFTPLIQSTEDSMLIDSREVASNFDPEELIRSFVSLNERYTLAARISGVVETAYPDGPAPQPEDEEEGVDLDDLPIDQEQEPLPDHLAQSIDPVNIILVADTDILDDRFWVSVQDFFGQRIIVPNADNADFVVNAIENLMGSNDLISLRGRGRDNRPLTAIDQLRRSAEAQYIAEQQRLQGQLAETEQRLAALQIQGGEIEGEGPTSFVLTPEEEAEIERFRRQLLSTRQELRAVQRNLRADIEVLENWVRFINILVMPVGVALTAVGLTVLRRRRRVGKPIGVQ